MSRHDLRPFIKTARRGSAYCTPGAEFWIVRRGDSCHLIRWAKVRPTVKTMRTLARTGTLREAVDFYRTEVAR